MISNEDRDVIERVAAWAKYAREKMRLREYPCANGDTVIYEGNSDNDLFMVGTKRTGARMFTKDRARARLRELMVENGGSAPPAPVPGSGEEGE